MQYFQKKALIDRQADILPQCPRENGDNTWWAVVKNNPLESTAAGG